MRLVKKRERKKKTEHFNRQIVRKIRDIQKVPLHSELHLFC